jgi:hypothetical protein
MAKMQVNFWSANQAGAGGQARRSPVGQAGFFHEKAELSMGLGHVGVRMEVGWIHVRGQARWRSI